MIGEWRTVGEWIGLDVAAAALLLLVAVLAALRRTRSFRDERRAAPAPAHAADAPETTAWQGAHTPARGSASAEALLRVVRTELQSGHEEGAVAHWLALVAAGLDAHAEPALSIRLAALLRERGRNDEAAGALRAALRRSGGPTGVTVAARVARAAADLDAPLAADAAWRALASPELDELDRQDLEHLLERLQSGTSTEPSEGPRAPEEPSGEVAERLEPTPPAEPGRRPEPIDLGQHSRRLEVASATPVELEPAGLRVALAAGGERVIGWREIDAIAVGAVDGLGPKPVLVIDLVAGGRRPAEEPLRIVRLQGDRYDPRKIAPGPSSPVDAFRELVDRLLGESGAAPLPDLRAVRGRPFAGFRSLTAFEEDVLASEEGGSAGRRS